MTDPRANPLADGSLLTRADVQRAVRQLYEPLLPYTSSSGALVRLGSFGSVFPERVAELEGYARPLYGIVPLTVGGGRFDHWDLVASGLDAGTDPRCPDYWGPVMSSPDQRMVEQAAIGLALAFCPDQIWEPLSAAAKDRVTDWLHGIYRFDPVPNNWQFFRVLVSLGLERVGRNVDREKLEESVSLLESYRRGDHWYVDGALENVDYYVPFAFHTYGLMYAAANRLGLGDDDQAARYAERAAAFADDFVHWFAPDGAAIPYGRSLTYRFAMASFWGAAAWADVDGIDWGVAKGIAMRHLRWWADKPISDRDGVVSIGFAYDNRRLAESYNSAGSPYWCMKYFGGLAAPEDHTFWRAEEAPLPEPASPVTIRDAGWVLDRDDDQAVALVGRSAPPFTFMEQTAAKYDKFAYSSSFGFSGDLEPALGAAVTDSTLAIVDDQGTRLVRSAARLAGVEDGMAWSVWIPRPGVRVDTVVWGGAPWHGRFHRIRTDEPLRVEESGFALAGEAAAGRAEVSGPGGRSLIVGAGADRAGEVRQLPVNANLMTPRSAVPLLVDDLRPGDHSLGCAVYASPRTSDPGAPPPVPDAAPKLLARVIAMDAEPWPG